MQGEPDKNHPPFRCLQCYDARCIQTHWIHCSPARSTRAHNCSSFKRVHRGTLSLPGTRRPSVVAVLQVHSGNVAAEVGVLLKLGQNQPRLVQFFGQCTDGTDTLLVMEFAPMGSLDKALEDIEDTITPGHRVAILQQVCAAMETLVAHNLIHRDLALRNVLLFSYNPADVSKTSVKVSDFGLTVSTPLPYQTRTRPLVHAL